GARSTAERHLREVCDTCARLGVVDPATPLAAAALARASGETLRAALDDVLAALDVEDAKLAYRAIRLAAPAGLGTSARHDVREEPKVSLLEAMREAAARDRIAAQYASGFADVLDLGVVRLASLRQRGWPETWTVTGTYLGFLARFEDSHLVRKFGPKTARAVREKAAVLDRRLLESPMPAALEDDLLALDADLKASGLNPGTSADLTVASHFAASLARHS
ncbi:MAG: triphosphoribosyl-dephospho-CoA synthase, partial [Geminicoccaceae bacterium]